MRLLLDITAGTAVYRRPHARELLVQGKSKQSTLAFEAPSRVGNTKPTRSRKRDHVLENQCAARLILADEAKYGGCDAAVVQWARQIMERA
jgi:hypothetical protein